MGTMIQKHHWGGQKISVLASQVALIEINELPATNSHPQNQHIIEANRSTIALYLST